MFFGNATPKCPELLQTLEKFKSMSSATPEQQRLSAWIMLDDIVAADPVKPVDPATFLRPEMHADTRSLDISLEDGSPAWACQKPKCFLHFDGSFAPVETYDLNKSDPFTAEQALVWEERTKRGFQQWVDQERMLKYAKSRAIAPNGLCTTLSVPFAKFAYQRRSGTDQRFARYRTMFEEGLLFKLFGAA